MGRDEGVHAEKANYVLGQGAVLVSHVLSRWPVDYAKKTREENVQWLVDDIRAQTPARRPAFMHVMALSWAFKPADIVDVHQRLGGDYVAVTAPSFTRLFREYRTR